MLTQAALSLAIKASLRGISLAPTSARRLEIASSVSTVISCVHWILSSTRVNGLGARMNAARVTVSSCGRSCIALRAGPHHADLAAEKVIQKPSRRCNAVGTASLFLFVTRLPGTL